MSAPGYQYLVVHFVMRECNTKEEAIERLEQILPQYPDDNYKYCESWVVEGSEAWEE